MRKAESLRLHLGSTKSESPLQPDLQWALMLLIRDHILRAPALELFRESTHLKYPAEVFCSGGRIEAVYWFSLPCCQWRPTGRAHGTLLAQHGHTE